MAPSESTCSVSDCDRKHYARGWCQKHYNRWLTFGPAYVTAPKPRTAPRGRKPKPITERFWPKVDRRSNDECWNWKAASGPLGYGTFVVNGKSRPSHRVAYELMVGPIPDELPLDHLCRNPSCVNPAHLEPVSNQENILRGIGPSAQHARKTHCPKGHPYDLLNTMIRKSPPARICRTCHNEYTRQRYHQQKQYTKERERPWDR